MIQSPNLVSVIVNKYTNVSSVNIDFDVKKMRIEFWPTGQIAIQDAELRITGHPPDGVLGNVQLYGNGTKVMTEFTVDGVAIVTEYVGPENENSLLTVNLEDNEIVVKYVRKYSLEEQNVWMENKMKLGPNGTTSVNKVSREFNEKN